MALAILLQMREPDGTPGGRVARRPHPYFETHLEAYLADTFEQIEAAGWSVELGVKDVPSS